VLRVAARCTLAPMSTRRGLLARLRNRNLPPGKLADRREFILERCAGRRVLHLGCVDRPYLEEKLASGTLLHAVLVERAADALGIDSDPDGVRLFEERGWPTICADVERLPELDFDFDLVVAGEIIEHLSNPGLFLDSLARRLGPGIEVILTTPNAYAVRRYWRFLLGHEQVHPDHVAYYSPLTLREALRRAGFVVTEEHPYPIGREFTDVPWYYRAFERAGTIFQPWTADGLIVVARTPALPG
jgi:SAM-dependent methyltransferase